MGETGFHKVNNWTMDCLFIKDCPTNIKRFNAFNGDGYAVHDERVKFSYKEQTITKLLIK